MSEQFMFTGPYIGAWDGALDGGASASEDWDRAMGQHPEQLANNPAICGPRDPEGVPYVFAAIDDDACEVEVCHGCALTEIAAGRWAECDGIIDPALYPYPPDADPLLCDFCLQPIDDRLRVPAGGESAGDLDPDSFEAIMWGWLTPRHLAIVAADANDDGPLPD